MGEGRTSVILQWAKHRIGIDLVTHSCQNAAAIIVAEVITVRGSSTVINDVSSPSPSLKNSVPNRYRPAAVVDAATDVGGPVAAKRALGESQRTGVVDAAAAANAIGGSGPVTA